MLRLRPHLFLLALCFGCLVLAHSVGHAGEPDDPAALDRLIQQQQWQEAAEVARTLSENESVSARWALPLARLARSFQQREDLSQAAEFYNQAVRTLDADADTEAVSASHRVLVRLAAGSVLAQLKHYDAGVRAVAPVLDAQSAASAEQRSIAVSVLLRLGSGGLTSGHAAVAAEAYTLAKANAEESQMATALLGEAWATAIMRDQPKLAAEKLTAFLERYPEHTDAPNAARACAECWRQADQPERAAQQLDDLIQKWPESSQAVEAIRMQIGIAADLVSDAAAQWLMLRAKHQQFEHFDADVTRLAIAIATTRQELEAWSNLTRHLAKIDDSGQLTSDVLSSLLEQNQAAEAERLAAMLVAPSEDLTVTAKAREAACRWAGRQQKWSMLALASENVDLTTDSELRSEATERLMAEALTQTGQHRRALQWWTHLVEERNASDFSTLLRCAEVETSTGQDASVAEQRIEAARQAAGDDRFRVVLVNLVDAELAIRRSQFNEARAYLESVVRESDTAAHLRGRAQWLIGETYYLQQHFAQAISAYRRVEGIDPGGVWVPASLVQAGKSFEQLGRSREASICYGHLLQRFADTSHAATARRRMAALQPNTDSAPTSSPSPIRR